MKTVETIQSGKNFTAVVNSTSKCKFTELVRKSSPVVF